MSYTLAAAATATGTNKTTILRAIKSGKISAAKDEHGCWHVEPVELRKALLERQEKFASNNRVAQSVQAA
jgi:hypothetical protein